MTTHCIYHYGCPDGWTSAWVLKQAIPDAILHPGRYGEPPPVAFSDATVYIVDFSYPADQIREIAATAEKVIILDHHKTARKNLEDVDLGPNVTVVFDMDRSGAMITFDHFNRSPSYAATLVSYVQDRDLWADEMESSVEVGALILATNHTMEEWTTLAETFAADNGVNQAAAQGAAILKRDRKVQKEILDCARRMTIGGHEVLVVASPYAYGSYVAGELAKTNGSLFGAYYVDKPDHRQFGLRSVKGSGCDVSAIAEQYGGGGHAEAAGFNVPRDHPLACG